jgi:succinate dehydrogenase hydrophobic anchor subunit
MVLGNQSISSIFFWLFIFIFAILAGSRVMSKIWNIPGSISWKLQRISGAYLFVMIPAHLLFMHLQPAVGHQADIVIARMQNVFIKFVDLTLVVGTLYHAGYGLLSISRDYLKSRLLQTGLAALIVLIMAVFGWVGIRLTLFI